MVWVHFDEDDRRKPAPDFCLQKSGGGRVCLGDYREGCNLVLVFARSVHQRSDQDLLEGFADRWRDYLTEEAKILVVIPGEPGLEEVPLPAEIPLLFDPNGAVRRKFAGLMDDSLVSAEDTLIFVLDRYTALYTALIGADLKESTLHEDLISWLRYIEVQCPE